MGGVTPRLGTAQEIVGRTWVIPTKKMCDPIDLPHLMNDEKPTNKRKGAGLERQPHRRRVRRAGRRAACGVAAGAALGRQRHRNVGGRRRFSVAGVAAALEPVAQRSAARRRPGPGRPGVAGTFGLERQPADGGGRRRLGRRVGAAASRLGRQPVGRRPPRRPALGRPSASGTPRPQPLFHRQHLFPFVPGGNMATRSQRHEHGHEKIQ